MCIFLAELLPWHQPLQTLPKMLPKLLLLHVLVRIHVDATHLQNLSRALSQRRLPTIPRVIFAFARKHETLAHILRVCPDDISIQRSRRAGRVQRVFQPQQRVISPH